ncbi:MAG TPA: trehalase family glycosidase, partial [Polyangiaceae bacterium]|nr:trehalase family glycosidase [Polyangiaceae bacterium]
IMFLSVRASLAQIAVGLGGLAACTPSSGPALAASTPSPAQAAGVQAASLPYETLDQVRFRLLEEQDTDCDQKITVRDQSSRRFLFRLHGEAHDYRGTYALANLLEELTLARRNGTPLRLDRIGEDPIARLSRRIRSEYWPALTRQLDEDGLPEVLEDTKVQLSPARVLYVPSDDARAYAYFRKAAQRYDAAFAELARATAGVGQSELGSAELTAMLGTPDGRESVAEMSRRLGSAALELDYPGLVRHLSGALGRIGDYLEQASRSCVNTHSGRLAHLAERTLSELAKFAPKTLTVQKLPERREWPEWSAALGAAHGALSLALEEKGGAVRGVPFVVPGGRFNEMYGWDSHFIARGLIADEQLELARGLVDNAVYEIEHYGATLNANRSYYLTRSQPPLLAATVRALWDATPAAERDPAWLARALGAAIREYDEIWSKPPRRSSVCRGEGDALVCLDRYAGVGRGQPPEVEPGHFDWLWQQVGRSLEPSYRARELASRDLVGELDRAFEHDRCMRESGHDTTYRWFWDTPHPGGPARPENRCADMLTVDLNSLLYEHEVDVAYLLGQLKAARTASAARAGGELGPAASVWCERSKHRFELMKAHLWSARDGLFYDALLAPTGTVQTGYVSATTLYPLWALGDSCDASPPPFAVPEKSLLVTNALLELEAAGGLLASARASRERFSSQADRQWDYPNGWAPHQMIAWRGLDAQGFHEDADRLTTAWLFMLASNAIDYNGVIPEKYDVVERTHAVFSEYGNVGADFDYITSEGFGWMNASFEVGLARLSPEGRRRLNQSLAAR